MQKILHLISKKNVQIKDKNWKRYNLFWNYKSFDIHVFDEGKYLAPVITGGKYVEKTAEQHFHFRLIYTMLPPMVIIFQDFLLNCKNY